MAAQPEHDDDYDLDDDDSPAAAGNGQRQDPQWLRDLRRENKRLKKELDEFRPVVRRHQLQEAGLDLNNPQHRFIADHYPADRPVTAEAIVEYVGQYGFDLGSGGQPQQSEADVARDQTQNRIDQVRTLAAPAGAQQRVSWDQFKEIMHSNPREGLRLQEAQLVDVPAHVAASEQTARA